MSQQLLRSNIEFSKRVHLDRMATGAQPMMQPADIDEGPGDPYVYAGVPDPYNFGIGFDCSGGDSIFVGAAVLGAAAMSWTRQFSTETFPGGFAGFRQVSQTDLINNSYPIKVMICHGGGGPNSHMAMVVDGWHMESNGDHGCVGGTDLHNPDITPYDSNYWNDWWVYDGPIIEDTTRRQPMGYPQGYDYAGGRPSGAALKAAGVTFVMRYLTDGGAQLPGKQLLGPELADLTANGIRVGFNWETTADFMLAGGPEGKVDAASALSYIHSIGGPASPVVFFSCDFDEAPGQQDAINNYLATANAVLGGPQFTGIYGSYYVCQRALNAGVCGRIWQTEAWSGGNVESRVDIYQRNDVTGVSCDGVSVDVNEAHTDPGGFTWLPTDATPPAPVPTNTAGFAYPSRDDMVLQLWEQAFGPQAMGWDFFGKSDDGSRNKYSVEALRDLWNGSAPH